MQSLRELCSVFFDGCKDGAPRISPADLQCFRQATEQFCASGKKEDAFTVYFCYNEVFHLLGSGYENTQRLLELLADHEYHSGELLMKHRDHYAHSAYVFALGLSVYANDSAYRAAFCACYGLPCEDYVTFLYLWGMTSLFHDIGYPFQLAHEQIKAYSEKMWGKDCAASPFVTFGNLDAFWSIGKESSAHIRSVMQTDAVFENVNDLLAYGLYRRLGYPQEVVRPLLAERVRVQPQFMDHAYFSAVLLARQLFEKSYREFSPEVLDVLTAILLHNSLNKYDLGEISRPVACSEHPLAYLLILCDELQCWDREAFGYVSKRAPLPWQLRLSIGADSVRIEYQFDSLELHAPDTKEKKRNPLAVDIEQGKFVQSILAYVTSPVRITASVTEQKKVKKTRSFASSDKFINLCDFAKAIHQSYTAFCAERRIESIEEAFGALPLEFKLSNIEQAKSYAQKLELINCFYSDKELDYPVVDDFGDNVDEETKKPRDDVGFLCREEHVRWVKEKLRNGWKYGRSYVTVDAEGHPVQDRALRNTLREHMDIVPYEMLDEVERQKDEIAVRNMVPLLFRLGNIRIYRYRYGRKPDLEIAGVGHRHFAGDRERIKEQVKALLVEYSKQYHVIVRSCYAAGADQLIAECATELGLTTKAVLPLEYEEYIRSVYRDAAENGYAFTAQDELRMRHLLAQTAVCKVVKDATHTWMEAGKYVIGKCDKVIAIWDGLPTKLHSSDGEPINRGGTYHCIYMARQRGLKDGQDIHVIPCDR